jgi:hypothetical protein
MTSPCLVKKLRCRSPHQIAGTLASQLVHKMISAYRLARRNIGTAVILPITRSFQHEPAEYLIRVVAGRRERAVRQDSHQFSLFDIAQKWLLGLMASMRKISLSS